jgi:hypothetical protein
MEGRWLGWYARAHHYDGMLRWAYDSWKADPVRDARHVLWPAGDCFMVYPGANSSIRFEKMREGIVDYEKLAFLIDHAARSTDPAIKLLLKKLEQQLQYFISEHDFKKDKLEIDLQTGKKIIEELSDKL